MGKGKSWHCSACGQGVRGSFARAHAWLATPCGQLPTHCAQTRLPGIVRASRSAPSRLKGALLHPSHNLFRDQGLEVWFCWTCGAVARHALQDLGKRCPGGLTLQGRDNLSRLDKGLLPGSGPEARQYNAKHNVGNRYLTGLSGRLGDARAVSSCAWRRWRAWELR